MKHWISFSISCFSIVLSVIAIGVSLPKVGVLNFDYYGAIIGVLSFLITVLMGYQIYTVINVKEELKEINQAREEINEKLFKQEEIITEAYKAEFEFVTPLFLALTSRKLDDIIENSFGVFYRCEDGSWSKNLARDVLLLSLPKINDIKGKDSLITNLSKKVTEQELVSFFKDYNDRVEAKLTPCQSEITIILTSLLSKIKES